MAETEVDAVPAEVQAPAKSPIAEVQAPAKSPIAEVQGPAKSLIVEEHEEAGPVRKFPIDAGLQKKLRQNLPLFVKKGAKKKTELQEKDVGPLLRTVGLNPSEEQIAEITQNARSKERPITTKGFFDYENFEQKVAEYLVLNPDGFARHPVEKIMEAMNICLEGKTEVDAATFKKMMMTKGNAPFTEAESTKMMQVARDFDTGMVYCKEYAALLAQDGIPLPPDPLEPSDEKYR